MADTSDVENALVTLLDGFLYPSGDTSASAIGVPARIYRGWPNSQQLDIDLAAGVAHITIMEAAGYSRLADGYLDQDVTIQATPTITATVSTANVLTIGGTPGAGQAVGVIVDGVPYAYSLTATDTLATAASALAALVGGGTITDYAGNPIAGLSTDGYAVASGATITFSTQRQVAARVACMGQSVSIPRNQLVGFRITLWTPSPAARDTLARFIDANLSAIRFITLADQTSGRLLWRNTTSDDVPQKEQLWKRDFLYTVQFSTSLTQTAMQVLWGLQNITSNTPTGAATSAAVQVVS